jgi:hypothetical protein
MTASTPSNAILLHQFNTIKANGFLEILIKAATQADVPPEMFVAIGSRETNLINELGDFQGGEHHGVGITQGDIQHPEIRKWRDDGTWQKDPQVVQNFTAGILADYWNQIDTAYPDLTDEQSLLMAASSYNAGVHGSIRGYLEGDCDRHTTGHDYGHDVVARMNYFATLMAAPIAAPVTPAP